MLNWRLIKFLFTFLMGLSIIIFSQNLFAQNKEYGLSSLNLTPNPQIRATLTVLSGNDYYTNFALNIINDSQHSFDMRNSVVEFTSPYAEKINNVWGVFPESSGLSYPIINVNHVSNTTKVDLTFDNNEKHTLVPGGTFLLKFGISTSQGEAAKISDFSNIKVLTNTGPVIYHIAVSLGEQHFPDSVIAGSVSTESQTYVITSTGPTPVSGLTMTLRDAASNIGAFSIINNTCKTVLSQGENCHFAVQYAVPDPSKVSADHTDISTLSVSDAQGDQPQISPQPSIIIKPSSSPTPSSSSGTLYYHAYLPITSVTDFATGNHMNLTGGNYDDLILSNYVAGAMLGHLIDEKYPFLKDKYNKDYVYGMILGQLLQENQSTELYKNSTDLIDPFVGPKQAQAAMMGVGQGGPYQINSYAYDQIQSGHNALVNFVTLQKNIGYTVAEGSSQPSKKTPASFNNKYYSPMLTTYFHLNDLLINIPANLEQCLKKIGTKGNAASPLDVLLSYSYNQGPWGSLLSSAVADCLNMPYAAFIEKYDNYQNAIGDSYHQYPYQVRYYLDELYNRATISSTVGNPPLHIIFKLSQLKTIFVNVFHKLAYLKVPGDIHSIENYQYIPEAIARDAFDNALNMNDLSGQNVLDLSNAKNRATMFTVLDVAINTLEKKLQANFLQAEPIQIGEKLPLCPSNPDIYPTGIGSYKGGTVVQAKNQKLYQCKSDQLSAWCNQAAYEPGGANSNAAWTLYQCRKS